MISSKFFIVSAALLLAVASATRTLHQEGATDAQTGTIPRRKLIVHIGPHKTGTTDFQNRLAVNGGVSPSLVYPKTCGVPTQPKGFAAMAHSYLKPIDPQAALQGKLAKLVGKKCSPDSAEFRRDFYSTTSDIIISAEAFSAFGRAAYQKLRDDFAKDFDVHVVIVRADSRAMLLSHFHQNEKATATVSEYANQVWKEADNIERIPPCRFASEKCIHSLSDVFGRDNVHLVRFNQSEPVACITSSARLIGLSKTTKKSVASNILLIMDVPVLSDILRRLEGCWRLSHRCRLRHVRKGSQRMFQRPAEREWGILDVALKCVPRPPGLQRQHDLQSTCHGLRMPGAPVAITRCRSAGIHQGLAGCRSEEVLPHIPKPSRGRLQRLLP